ncbi:RHS repeat-associated core domain-containing protein [Kitasatospora sp. NPDC003701]
MVPTPFLTNQPLWSSGTTGNPGASATMQTDGNFAVYDTNHKTIWASNTSANPGAYARIQDDGNFVVYSSAAKPLWSSNTSKATYDVGNVTYPYDAVGHLATAVADNISDGAGRLTRAAVQDSLTFTYDADGNRVSTKVNNTPTRTIAWDINNPLPQIASQTDGAGQLIGDYTYDPLGLPQSQHTNAGTFYNHHDWLGSITDLTNANGTPQSRTTYDPYGRAATTTLATGAPTTPFGFTGQYNEPGLPGKQYLRAREYDPSLGRFTARDPLSIPASSPYASPYTYAAGAPTLYTDPTGLSPEDDNDDVTLGNFGSWLAQGAKAPFEFVGDLFNAVTGRNGGASAFIDKYIPIRPAYATYVAAAKLREFGCNNVADKVEKQADELASQVVVAGLGGVRNWGRKTFGEKAEIAGGGAAIRRWWAADIRTTMNGDTYLIPSTPGLEERINPGCGTHNCGPVSLATDQLLAGKNPPPASAADNTLLPDQFLALAGSSQPFVQKGGLSGIVSDMQSWGNGARGIVMGQPSAAQAARGQIGHFFNVINDNGAVVFLDAQTGRAAPEGWRYYYILRTN